MKTQWLSAMAAVAVLATAGAATARPRDRFDGRGQSYRATSVRPPASRGTHDFRAVRTQPGFGRIVQTRPAFNRPVVVRPAFGHPNTRPVVVRPRFDPPRTRPIVVRPSFPGMRPVIVRPSPRPWPRRWVISAPVRPYVFTTHHHGLFAHLRALRASALHYAAAHAYSLDARLAELARLESELASIQSGSGWATSYAEYNALVRAILDLRASLGGYAPAPTVSLAMY